MLTKLMLLKLNENYKKMYKDIPKEFNPSVLNPAYFIRHCVLKGLHRNKNFMTGIMMDFGCGAKPYQSLFIVNKYIGVDYKGDGHNHENENIDVYYDGKTIPFSEDYFDSVLATEVFEHLFEIETILKELNRVIKQGGKIIITTPFVWNLHEVPIDYARYTPFALEHLLNKNGFRVLKSEQNGGYTEIIPQLSILYFLKVFKTKSNNVIIKLFSKIAIHITILLINIVGIFIRKLFPNYTDLYLSNLIVAEKI